MGSEEKNKILHKTAGPGMNLEASFNLIKDQVTHPFLVFDPGHKILYANKAFRSILPEKGRKLEDLPLREIFKIQDDLIADHFSSENISESEHFRLKMEFIRPAIEKQAIIYPLNIDGHFVYMMVFPDLSPGRNPEISQPERDICEEISRINDSYFWSLYLDSNLFFAQPATYRMLGIENFSGGKDMDEVLELCLTVKNKEKLLNELEKYITGDHRSVFRFILKLKPGKVKTRARKLLFSARFREGNRNIMVGIIREPLMEKQYEEELKQFLEKSKKADNFRLNFLKNLSYEIRTPMNSILGFSELLNQKDLTEEKINEYTTLIRQKGKYLHTLIDDVIEISQYEAGTISFNKTVFKLQPILNELFEEFETKRKNLNKDNVTFVMFVPEDSEDQEIYTDPGRLYQLLSNLLSNALKFTQRGRIEFGYRKGGKYIKFYVADTGPGLSEEEKKKIFNRFEQLEETALRKYSGTGLSLTISKYIVEQMGGKIKVKSEINKGSKFQISIPDILPSENENQKEAPVNRLEDVDWKDKVILIAEDEEVNYRFLEALISRTGAKVLRAKNGQEAVDLCRTISKIDIVLMDIKMPVMNGYDAIIAIKRIRTNLPIIAQTAFAAHAEIIKCQSVGCDDFITKPIDINLLINKIERKFNT